VLSSDTDINKLPRRRTDGARIVDTGEHSIKLYTTPGGSKLIKRWGASFNYRHKLPHTLFLLRRVCAPQVKNTHTLTHTHTRLTQMHTQTRTYRNTHTNAYTNTCIHTHTNAYTHMCTYTRCIHKHVHTHTNTYTHTNNACMPTLAPKHVQT